MMDVHCKGCKSHHSAGRLKPSNDLKKYNDWCCKFGGQAKKKVGHCKNVNGKEATQGHDMGVV